MPSEIVDQRQMSSFCLSSPRSSFFSEEIAIPAQRQIGFWRSETAPDHPGTEGISLNLGGQDFPSSPLGKHPPMGTNIVESLDPLQSCFLKEQHNSFRLEPLSMELRSPARISATNHKGADQQYALLSKQPVESSLLFMEGKIYPNGLRQENGLFSSSLSAVFNNKFRLSSNEVSFGQSIDAARISFEEDEPLESLEELEAQTIGDLLPDDDDLLSVAISDSDYQPRPIGGDDVEDDLFCSGGGLELEADDNFSCFRAPKMIGGGMINVQNGGLNCPVVGEHVFGGCPSRTLIARNINDNVEDAELRALFEQYGDIHTLYTASKHHGFLMVTYYDIRAAQNAIRALQNKPWRHQKLDIHFSIQKGNPLEEEMDQGMVLVDSSIPNDNLKLMFGVYGEIKEIHEAPHRQFHKLIEFYDLRAAEAALHALNNTDIGAKIIKLKPSCPGGASFMRHFSPRVEHEELSRFRLQIPSNNSPPVCSGSIPFGAITTTSLDNGAIQGLHSGAQGPFDQFMEPELNRICSSVPHVASAPVRIPSADNHGNQCGPAEATHSFGLASLGVQGMQPFHAHSLPEFDDGKINGVPRNSLSTVPAMGIHGNSRPVDVVESRRFHTVGSGGLSSHSFEQNEAFGVFASGSCPIHGHGFVWNNADSYHNRPSGPMMWPSPTAYMNNNMSAHPLHGFPRTPSHVPNTVLLLHHHHVGSAPAVNPSLWERRHMYAGDPIEPSAFHPGSLGSIGFSGGPPMHPVELAHHIFPYAGGNCTDHPMSPMHIGIPSPQQRCHMFHGRGPMVPIPATFDVPSDRTRSRRNDANISQADLKKQYELDIDRILRGEDSRTTLMIKNIPNKYTSKMLLATIDEHHRGTYDFIYLPIDFKNKCNVGYAFINLTDPKHIIPFFKTFNGKKWEKFNSEKVASLAYARIQGKAALIAHFQNSSLMNEDKRCRPILFHSDGPNAGDQEPFPMGDNVRSRPGRSRTADHEHLEGSPSSSPTRERSSPNVTDQPTTTQYNPSHLSLALTKKYPTT